MTCYWRQLFHSPVGTEAPAQGRAPQHWQHLREGCSVQRQNPAGSKKGRMRKSSLEGFRAAGQVLPLPCGKPTLAGSAGRTLAVEDTHRSRGACGRWRTEVLLWIVFPTLSTLPEKKPNKQQAISLCSSYPQTFFYLVFSICLIKEREWACSIKSHHREAFILMFSRIAHSLSSGAQKLLHTSARFSPVPEHRHQCSAPYLFVLVVEHSHRPDGGDFSHMTMLSHVMCFHWLF